MNILQHLTYATLLALGIASGCGTGNTLQSGKSNADSTAARVELDTTALREKKDSLQSFLGTHRENDDLRSELETTLFELQYAYHVTAGELDKAERHIQDNYREKKEEVEKQGDSGFPKEYYDRYRNHIENLQKEREQFYEYALSGAETFENVLDSILQPVTKQSLTEAETFLDNVKQYVREQGNKAEFLRPYERKVEAKKLKKKAEEDGNRTDLEEIADGWNGKNRFKKHLNHELDPMDYSGKIEYLDSLLEKGDYPGSNIPLDIVKRKRNEVRNQLDNKMRRGYEPDYELLRKLNYNEEPKNGPNTEGIYNYRGYILVITNFTYSGDNPSSNKKVGFNQSANEQQKIEATVDATSDVKAELDKNENFDGLFSARNHEKFMLPEDFFLKYKTADGEETLLPVGEDEYQVRVKIDKVKATWWEKIQGYPTTKEFKRTCTVPITFVEKETDDRGQAEGRPIYSGTINGMRVVYKENDIDEKYTLKVSTDHENASDTTYIMVDVRNKSSILPENKRYSDKLDDKIDRLKIITGREDKTYLKESKLKQYSGLYNRVRQEISKKKLQ